MSGKGIEVKQKNELICGKCGRPIKVGVKDTFKWLKRREKHQNVLFFNSVLGFLFSNHM